MAGIYGIALVSRKSRMLSLTLATLVGVGYMGNPIRFDYIGASSAAISAFEIRSITGLFIRKLEPLERGDTGGTIWTAYRDGRGVSLPHGGRYLVKTGPTAERTSLVFAWRP